MSERPTILAFGAHPDDIEFGCGGVIARETRAGRKAHFVICSRGEAASNGTPTHRAAEAKRGAELLGATLEFIELGGDAHLEASVGHALELAAVLRRVKPTLVLAPTPEPNQHPDHAVVGKLVRDAARLARYGGVKELKKLKPHAIEALLFFAVGVEGEPAGEKPVLIDVSEPTVLKTWTAAMLAHASQAQTRRYVELQLARASVNGARCGANAAIALWPNDPLVFDSLATIRRSARRF